MGKSSSKIVIDTCVVVGAYRREDEHCSRAIERFKKQRHTLVVCEQLIREYRGTICRGDPQLYSVVDRLLFARWLRLDLKRRPDPEVRIPFGPPEDRFHMQLAIDARAGDPSCAVCHVTKDGGVLAEAESMGRYGVNEVHPESCAECRL